jgi:PPM family protein phosphatase
MRSRPKKRRKGGRRSRSLKGRVSHWSKSDLGLKREVNEDSFLADSNLGLYMVADGMGGHAGGDTASRMAVEIIRDNVRRSRKAGDLFSSDAAINESPPVLRMLDQAIKEASASIFEASASNPDLEGMGTTVTLALTHGKRAYVAHVGDSRLYRLRSGDMIQVTEDHSLVNEQIKAGFITAEEAAHSRFRNIITRSVGFESHVNADTFSIVMLPGDVFLICSDGLNGMIEDEEIVKYMRRGNLSSLPSRLVTAANQAGGEDNISVIVLRYDGADARQGPAGRRRKRKKKQRK